MKKRKPLRRSIVHFTIVILFLAILLLLRGYFKNKVGNDTFSNANSPETAVDNRSELAKMRYERRERSASLVTYDDGSVGERLRIAHDHVVLRAENGRDVVVALNPIATQETLKERIAAISETDEVFPVAYVDGEDRTPEGRRLITSNISAKIPREQAERLAGEYGLSIVDFPEYAPDWVIFSATDPIDALEKIGGIRRELEVETADVLVARYYENMVLPNDTLIGDQWYLSESNGAQPGTDIDVEDAWRYGATGGVRGAGINIGIIDSGIQTNHPDFSGNINTAIDRDFISEDNDPSPVFDDENHATSVAGIAGARGNNNLGVSGVAPEATLVGGRLIAGVGITDAQVADALAYRTDVIQIKNNSWGSTIPFFRISNLVAEALENSAITGRDGKGTIFTFSAGNSGDTGDNANYSELTSSIYTIAVGATDSLGRRAFYSEPGANVVITAPSNGFRGSLGVTTTDRTGTSGYNRAGGASGDYADDFSGTSASCPVVTGVIALMLERNPELGWRDVQDILIRTADMFNPEEAGWKTNAAGLHFNNDYGAGLVDAADAVDLAATHTNLGSHTSIVASRNNLGVSIPNNSSGGSTVEFQLPTSNLVTEHVTVKLNITHSARGELDISLISPSGTVSQLAVRRSDSGDDYDDFTFSTVHNWGENSSGVWRLRVVDTSNGTNTTGGRINSAEMTIFGVVAAPVNPAPVVQINSPSTGQVFSPGVGFNVEVSASDFDINGDPENVARVELFQNGVPVATRTVTPFIFPNNPAEGTYAYVARATDAEGKESSSAPVFVTVKNQTPVINAAVVSAAGQAFDDEPIIVSPVDAMDAENDTISLAYRWQFSTDEVTYMNSAITTATLPADPSRSGKLWRCSITASDGNSISEPFLTNPVNLLDRPESAFPAGRQFSYQSGLVLRGDMLSIDRQAIIHELSQGPPGGTSEWVEILTLQAGSLAGWSFGVDTGRRLMFLDDPVWDNIPAGTLIVIYDGGSTKDPSLPVDSTDFSTGKMIISSTNASYFDQSLSWPRLSNLGESLFLNDSISQAIHEISYGNSLVATPNIGQVISGSAAYFAGETDLGASRADEWLVTSGTVSRVSTSAFDEFSVSPGIVLTGGRYSQNFNLEPGDNGTFFPTGWSGYTVDLAQTRTTNVDELIVFQGELQAGGVYNFGSKIGILGSDSSFDPGFIALGIDNTQGATGLRISYDLEKITEQGRSMDMQLQYTVSNPRNTSTVWTAIAGTSHRTGSSSVGTVDKFTNIALPPIFLDRTSPIFLRWNYRTSINNSPSGARDAIAIDNVIISSEQSPNILMGLSLNPASVAENAGANASTGTITLSQALENPLNVNVFSSDTTEATVPATVVIPAGDSSVTFPITVVDDRISDGAQPVQIRLSAVNFPEVSTILTVTDDEPLQIGVTPGFGNNTTNTFFIDRLRSGRLVEPPTFRLASGSVLPDGLTLDASTGLISGTISPSAALGAYPVTIELNNILFETRSQSIVINVTEPGSLTFSSWIALFSVSDTSTTGDSDLDRIPNLVEYALDSPPDAIQQPSPILFEQTASEISITFCREKDRADVSLVAEWSRSLESDSWETSGITETLLENLPTHQKIKASLAIVPGDPARFIRLRATQLTPP